MSRKQISSGGFTSLLALVVEATPNAYGITPIVQLAHEDAWMSPPLAMAFALVLMFPLFHLFSAFGEALSREEQVLPSWTKTLLVLPLILVLLYWLTFNVRVFSDIIRMAYLPLTPEWVIYAGFLAVCAFAAYHGLEVLTRVAVLVVALRVAFVGFAPFTAYQEGHFAHLLPLLARGPLPVLQSTLPQVGWFLESAVLALFYPMIKKPRYRSVVSGFGLTFITYYTQFLLTLLVFTAPLVSRMIYPALELVEMVTIGEFFERVDPVMVAVWSFAMLCKSSAFLLIITALLNRLLRVNIRTRLTWVTALLAFFVTALVIQDVVDEIRLYRDWWLWTSLYVLLDLYLLAWALHTHAKKSRGETNNESWNVTEGSVTDGST
ncbi:GerAB/ArcD/ProY family transporter [Tumebacillus sp. ITR2]|uniref:GerAB/ArcD/ProY family transporter n=1 Tax=Tumebacillus amylolyticus TaxID=2801339 RepID=A0ABS1JAH5_9BACL|nr:GerAB/ArcD/ProY family transporter [Tumebacillus amylolyticus]